MYRINFPEANSCTVAMFYMLRRRPVLPAAADLPVTAMYIDREPPKDTGGGWCPALTPNNCAGTVKASKTPSIQSQSISRQALSVDLPVLTTQSHMCRYHRPMRFSCGCRDPDPSRPIFFALCSRKQGLIKNGVENVTECPPTIEQRRVEQIREPCGSPRCEWARGPRRAFGENSNSRGSAWYPYD